MPLFTEALRDSKLFSLPPQSVAKCIKSKNVPRHQVIQAPSASAHRRDWGLKFPVVGAKTKQVEFESFEDRFATNGVNAFPTFNRRITNLEGLGAAITLPRSRRLRSLYDASASSQINKQQKGLEYLSDTEFSQKLQEAKKLDPTTVSNKIEALQRLGVAPYDPTGSTEPAKWQKSSIGASYASPAVLSNTPRGIFAQRPVRARALPGRAHRGAVAFGGFVATDVNGTTAQVPWYETLDLSVSSVGGTASGDVQINVHRETPQNTDVSSRLLDRSVNT